MPLRPLQATRLGRRPEVLEGRNPERLPHLAHGLGSHAGDPQQLHERGRDLGAQALVIGHASRPGQLGDLVADRLANPGDRAPVTRAIGRCDVECRSLDRIRGAMVGNRLERDLTRELEDVPDLMEDPRQVPVGKRLAGSAVDRLRPLGLVGIEGRQDRRGIAAGHAPHGTRVAWATSGRVGHQRSRGAPTVAWRDDVGAGRPAQAGTAGGSARPGRRGPPPAHRRTGRAPGARDRRGPGPGAPGPARDRQRGTGPMRGARRALATYAATTRPPPGRAQRASPGRAHGPHR